MHIRSRKGVRLRTGIDRSEVGTKPIRLPGLSRAIRAAFDEYYPVQVSRWRRWPNDPFLR